jgi:hypothetical protein
MAAGVYDFLIEAGATWSVVIDWQDQAGTGINLTSITLSGKIKRKALDVSEVVSFTFTKADQGTNPGRFTVSLTAEQTAKLPVKQTIDGKKEITYLPYDIEAVSSSSTERVLEGLVQISPEVTK